MSVSIHIKRFDKYIVCIIGLRYGPFHEGVAVLKTATPSWRDLLFTLAII